MIVARATELASNVQLPEITLKDVESGQTPFPNLAHLIDDNFALLICSDPGCIAEDMEDTARALQAGLSFVQDLVSPRVKRS